MLRLTPGTSIAFIEDQPVIVAQSRRVLFDVNQIGGYIGCRLEEGVSLRELVKDVRARGFAPAPATLRGILADWSLSGLVCATDDPPRTPPVLVQHIMLAGSALTLRHHDQGLAARVAPLFAHLESDARAGEICYDLWSEQGLVLLSREGGLAALLHRDQVGPLVKARFTQDILEDARWGLALHAGCLRRGGRALLLTGRPGAGKTTLNAWLMGAGFAYDGDDITMLQSDGRVRGLPFLPTVKSGAWPLMAARFADGFQPSVHRRPDGKRVRYLMPLELAEPVPVPVGWIVKLRRTATGDTRLVPLHPTASIRHLLSEAASATGEVDTATLATLIRAVTGARSYELHYQDLDEAARLLARLCDHGTA
ncbi:hypothetical protein [Sphingobium mellinum]|uniref:hypothetical protein n=1 Tax=Sphingobium mellinum TaxID=1387166 RepID=UPI0030EF021C